MNLHVFVNKENEFCDFVGCVCVCVSNICLLAGCYPGWQTKSCSDICNRTCKSIESQDSGCVLGPRARVQMSLTCTCAPRHLVRARARKRKRKHSRYCAILTIEFQLDAHTQNEYCATLLVYLTACAR